MAGDIGFDVIRFENPKSMQQNAQVSWVISVLVGIQKVCLLLSRLFHGEIDRDYLVPHMIYVRSAVL
jgi:hypothetical protein